MRTKTRGKRNQNRKRNLILFVGIMIAVFLLLLTAFCDIIPYPTSFWIFAFALAIVAAIFYAITTKKVLNGFLIIFVWFVLLAAGLEDLFVYMLFGKFELMPHLYDEPWMGSIAEVLSLETVTPLSLAVSIILGIILITFVILLFRYLRNKKWWPEWL